MRYKCLVLDHDDTVVDSTAQIHFPSFCEFLKIYRPGYHMTLEDYFRENFNPGFILFCKDKLQMTDKELDDEVKFWSGYVHERIPTAFQGIKKLIEQQKAEGGYICVVSHSLAENIYRDYKANGLPTPDMVFGWEQPPERRKPSPYSLEEIMKKFSLSPSELIMVDDLKPGYDMAMSCGVEFAAAGWSNDVPEIREFMKKNTKLYFKTVEEMEEYLF